MCGISAVIDFGSGRSLHTTVLRMHDRIPHRGPDGEGFLFVDTDYCPFISRHAGAVRELPSIKPWRLGMGFRWLKIQDLEESAAQPMCVQDRSVWLSLNGEIYNFLDLHAELQRQGYYFVTQSDTEVVLAAYQAWGTECFARFRGMWAMVIVDLRNKKVIISRDRFGIKQLFYYFDSARLILASEIKQIIAVSTLSTRANLTRVVDFIHGVQSRQCDETFFDDVLAVPAATYAEIDLSTPDMSPLMFTPYWRLADFHCTDPSMVSSFGDASATLDDLLRSSILHQMDAAVPVGSLLSGGLDSSTITALMVELGRQQGRVTPSFSLVFLGEATLDESHHVKSVAKHCGLHNYTTTFDAAGVKDNIPRLTWVQEEPLAGMAVAAQYRTYKLAATHGVRVILDGQGADELLAGYPRHQYVLLRDWLTRLRLLALVWELVLQVRASPRLFFRMTERAVSVANRTPTAWP